MPIIPPMRGKPCILTSLLPGDAALTVSIRDRRGTLGPVPTRGRRSNSPGVSWAFPFSRQSEHARVTILTTRPQYRPTHGTSWVPLADPRARGLRQCLPLGEGMRKVCRARFTQCDFPVSAPQ